jgi:PHD/YefM family antitoxin component YafN of YafNO toxin-antitoxin module
MFIKEDQSPMAARTAARGIAGRVKRLPITKARINLGAVVKRAHLAKEYFILEKDGIPVAGLMGVDEFEDYLELKDPAIRRRIRQSYEEYRAGKSRPARLLLAELQGGRRRRPSGSRTRTG